MFEHFYVTDLGKFGYLFIYLPFFLIIILFAYRWVLRHLLGQRIAAGVSVVLLGFVLGAPVWDIYKIGQVTKRLCEEKAGLHVYKTIESDGLFGSRDIEIWAQRGFSFTESFNQRDGKKYRYYLREGQVMTENIQEFSVSHGLLDYGIHKVADEHHGFFTIRVGDIDTNEVYAELVTVKTYPGWLDNFFIGVTGTGSGFSVWQCGDDPPYGRKMKLMASDVILAAIKPNKR